MDIKLINHEGHSMRTIAKVTGLNRRTVAKVLAGEHLLKERELECKLDGFRGYVAKRFAESGLSAARLLEEIRGQGYTGSIQILRLCTDRP